MCGGSPGMPGKRGGSLAPPPGLGKQGEPAGVGREEVKLWGGGHPWTWQAAWPGPFPHWSRPCAYPPVGLGLAHAHQVVLALYIPPVGLGLVHTHQLVSALYMPTSWSWPCIYPPDCGGAVAGPGWRPSLRGGRQLWEGCAGAAAGEEVGRKLVPGAAVEKQGGLRSGGLGGLMLQLEYQGWGE